MKKTLPTTMYCDNNANFAKVATDVPPAIAEELAKYPYEPTESGAYFIASRFRVSFSACDGDYSKSVKTPAAAAAKIREYIGEADADFGFVSDDGVCRCTGVEAFHAESKYGYRVPMTYLLNTFPSTPIPTT